MDKSTEILVSATKRLQRDLNYYHKELNEINNKLADCKDEVEDRKLREQLDETLAAVHVTREKMQGYARELTELGIEIDPEVSHSSKPE